MGEGKGFIAVYMLASGRRGTLYVGVTSELGVRIAQHREGTLAGFTKRYGVKSLVWFEEHTDIGAAIRREKAIKKYRCDWKINLIERENPAWADLYPRLFL